MVNIMLSRKLGELRITQAELAKKTGIRPNTINDLYHNVADRVGLEQLDKICEALQCDLTEIIEYSPNSLRTISDAETHTVYKTKK